MNEKEKRKSAYMRFGRSAPVGEMSPVFMPWANDDAYFIGQQPEKRKSAYMRFVLIIFAYINLYLQIIYVMILKVKILNEFMGFISYALSACWRANVVGIRIGGSDGELGKNENNDKREISWN